MGELDDQTISICSYGLVEHTGIWPVLAIYNAAQLLIVF